MKKNLILLSALFLIGITQVNAQCCKPIDSNAQSENATQQESKTLKLKITGMTCAGCEENVNHEVNKLTGIIKTNVSYDNGNAIIEFDRTQTDIQEIEKAITKTGYSVTDKKEIK